MKKLPYFFLSLIFWLFCFLPVFATHIVGGDLGLEHVFGNRYNINMQLYFDNINGNPRLIRNFEQVHFFRKSDDTYITTHRVDQVSNTTVPFTDPACAIANLDTQHIEYTAQVTLDPDDFDDPEGYYAVWSSCCRNGVITNIVDPRDAGQVFYMEFPPLTKDGSRYLNSSPEFVPVVNDYVCVNQPFYIDFSATDADGDLLAYSMSVPIDGDNSRNNAIPRPYSRATASKNFLKIKSLIINTLNF